jgi:hypothetical protein
LRHTQRWLAPRAVAAAGTPRAIDRRAPTRRCAGSKGHPVGASAGGALHTMPRPRSARQSPALCAPASAPVSPDVAAVCLVVEPHGDGHQVENLDLILQVEHLRVGPPPVWSCKRTPNGILCSRARPAQAPPPAVGCPPALDHSPLQGRPPTPGHPPSSLGGYAPGPGAREREASPRGVRYAAITVLLHQRVRSRGIRR